MEAFAGLGAVVLRVAGLCGGGSDVRGSVFRADTVVVG